MQPAVKKRNDKVIRNLAKNGIIGNYLYVSSKTGEGMTELKKAMLDADIKNHGDRIRPPQKPKKKKEITIHDLVNDSYEALDDSEMPQAIPGLIPGLLPKYKSEKDGDAVHGVATTLSKHKSEMPKGSRRKSQNKQNDSFSFERQGQVNVMVGQF